MKTDSKPRGTSAILPPVWQAIYDKLAQRLSDEVMREWVDHFELVSLTGRKMVILSHSGSDVRFFQAKYGDIFNDCVLLALGRSIQITFRQKAAATRKRAGLARRIVLLAVCVLLIAAAALVAILGGSFLINRNFRETFYQVSSGKVDRNLRVIQISDLHSSVFDGDNGRLVQRIQALSPDLIAMTGDCVEQSDDSYDVTVELCAQLTEIAPVFYIYGNDETTRVYGIDMTLDSLDAQWGTGEDARDTSAFRTVQDPLREALEDAGVTVLFNETATVEVQGCQVDVYGVLTSNPSAFWPYAGESYGTFAQENTQNFKLLLCHEPYIFETYGDAVGWADLTLCGHTHGGVIRLPYLGGVYEHSHGLLPELQSGTLIYGLYELSNCPLIVSSGLSNRGMIRVNNRPELVIVDVNRY